MKFTGQDSTNQWVSSLCVIARSGAGIRDDWPANDWTRPGAPVSPTCTLVCVAPSFKHGGPSTTVIWIQNCPITLSLALPLSGHVSSSAGNWTLSPRLIFPSCVSVFGSYFWSQKSCFLQSLTRLFLLKGQEGVLQFSGILTNNAFLTFQCTKMLVLSIFFPINMHIVPTVCVCLHTSSSTKVHSRSSNLAVFCTLSTDFIGLKMPQVRPGMKRVLVAIVVMQHIENEARKTVIWKQAAMSQDMRRWSDGKPQWFFTSYRAFATEIIFPSQNEEGKTHLALSVGKQLNVPSTWQQFRKTTVYKKLLDNYIDQQMSVIVFIWTYSSHNIFFKKVPYYFIHKLG